MYRTIEEFLVDWLDESDATLKIFRALTDASLQQRVTDSHRTLGRLAWHLVITVGEMMQHAGLPLDGIDEDAPVPGSAEVITRSYESAAKMLTEELPKHWRDEMLGESVNMYGQQWKRETVLAALIKHQIHHRGQMTVLMRQAGLDVPGIYGPAKHEWSAMQMTAPE